MVNTPPKPPPDQFRAHRWLRSEHQQGARLLSVDRTDQQPPPRSPPLVPCNCPQLRATTSTHPTPTPTSNPQLSNPRTIFNISNPTGRPQDPVFRGRLCGDQRLRPSGPLQRPAVRHAEERADGRQRAHRLRREHPQGEDAVSSRWRWCELPAKSCPRGCYLWLLPRSKHQPIYPHPHPHPLPSRSSPATTESLAWAAARAPFAISSHKTPSLPPRRRRCEV
jgi:hypothetical protein